MTQSEDLKTRHKYPLEMNRRMTVVVAMKSVMKEHAKTPAPRDDHVVMTWRWLLGPPSRFFSFLVSQVARSLLLLDAGVLGADDAQHLDCRYCR